MSFSKLYVTTSTATLCLVSTLFVSGFLEPQCVFCSLYCTLLYVALLLSIVFFAKVHMQKLFVQQGEAWTVCSEAVEGRTPSVFTEILLLIEQVAAMFLERCDEIVCVFVFVQRKRVLDMCADEWTCYDSIRQMFLKVQIDFPLCLSTEMGKDFHAFQTSNAVFLWFYTILRCVCIEN